MSTSKNLAIRLPVAFVSLAISATTTTMAQQSVAGSHGQTKVVLLGTGTPAANPDRSGPATAIIVNDVAYLVDAGPGIVRRAAAARRETGIAALEVTKLRFLFLTHLHSDHTLGFPDLIFTPWTLRRPGALEAYGPKGVKEMTDHLIRAYQVDVEERWKTHQLPSPQVNVHEVRAGLIYRDENVKVTAFPTKHSIESYGYRFDTADRSIVISGDTNPTDALVEACNGCDLLIHEVYSLAFLKTRPAAFQASAAKVHTTTAQLAEIAGRAKPRLLVLYHLQASSPEEAVKEMNERYHGRVAVGRDLDVY